MKKPKNLIEDYTYKDYTFQITYNKKDGNYYARNSRAGFTYSDDLKDLKEIKIPTVLYQTTEFKL